MQYPGLTAAESKALEETAAAIKADPQHLWEVMNFESRLDPKAANPLSSAKGLIQFMDSTAKGMGYKSSADLVAKFPTFTAQVKGPVRAYFEGSKPYPTRQSLYMKVFFPVARTVPPDTTFASLYAKYPSAGSIATFKKQNPGIVTVNDYVNKAMKRAQSMLTAKTMKVVKVGAAATGGLMLVGLWWMFLASNARPSLT
jgi:hypothetical protein